MQAQGVLTGGRSAQRRQAEEVILLDTSALIDALAGPQRSAPALRPLCAGQSSGENIEREIEIAIASCAITLDASIWTLNVRDFHDIPGVSRRRDLNSPRNPSDHVAMPGGLH